MATMPEPIIVAIFDLDKTITRHDTYLRFLMGFLWAHPRRLFRCIMLPIDTLAHWLGLRNNSWLKERFLTAVMGGLEQATVEAYVRQFSAQLMQHDIRLGALNAIKQHKKKGHQLIMVTASFDFYTEPLGRMLGMDHVICTKSVWNESSQLSGDIDGENCYGPIKVVRLKALLGDDRDQYQIIVYTDHHSDAPLLKWADQPIVVNPTRKLKAIAYQNGYDVCRWDKV